MVVVHAYNLSSQELESGGSRVRDHPQLHKKFEAGSRLHETFFFVASKQAKKISLTYAGSGSNTGNHDNTNSLAFTSNGYGNRHLYI